MAFTKEAHISFEQFAQDWLKTYSPSCVKISSAGVRKREMRHFISVWEPYPISCKKMYEERILELNKNTAKIIWKVFTHVEE